MRLLLDTVAFIWLAENDVSLSRLARDLIADPSNDVYLSTVSAWEIAIKYSIGRLELEIPPEEYVPEQRRLHRIEPLSIIEADALQVGNLPNIHRDPFDRLIIAQAIVQGMSVVTNDSLIRRYPVPVVW